MKMKMSLLVTVVAVAFVFGGTVFSGEPLKVFILAGQSNMQGQGNMSPVTTQGTLEYIVANEPEKFGHLKDGENWAVRDDVWIYYERDASTTIKGGLTAGFGANSSGIGPELQFGNVMGDYFDGQVLIIKTAWGGKSLAVDFRSDYVTEPVAAGQVGYYYKLMMDIVADVLTNLSTYFPAYNPADGYEIVGFGWHQGWNDRVTQTYNDEYEHNMENFIKNFRNDIGISNLPFVIATTGMTGWTDTHPRALSLMEAQLAMEDFTKYPEFKGNVAVDDTRDYYRSVGLSPADQGYHWNRNAETYCLIGNALATEMLEILENPWRDKVDINGDSIVDNVDFSVLASKWQQTGCDLCNGADLTGDGNVNIDDLLIVTNNWLGDYSDHALMGHWVMNGDALDSTYYANHGIVHGSPVWEPSQHSGGSMVFDGIDDYIDIEGYKGVTGRQSRTVSAWIKTSSVSGIIVSWGNSSYNGSKWIVRVSSTGTLRAEVGGGYISGTTDLTANDQWHHIAVVWRNDGSPDISEVKLYVDGQPESVADVKAKPINTATDEDVSIGTYQAGSAPFFNGLIDDVRIYRRALTQGEILELAVGN
ncbi:MAG: hypothetical protein K9M75_02375 [Phycisphaerae bacterium]|nr:hypothetical protein [Phycisphaerae bacterium]